MSHNSTREATPHSPRSSGPTANLERSLPPLRFTAPERSFKHHESMFSLPIRALARTSRASTSTSTAYIARPHPSRPPLLLSRTASNAPKAKPLKQSIALVDEAIPYPTITLVDPSTSSLLPPAQLGDILLQLDRSRFSIVLVDGKKEVPVCRIVDKKAEYEKAASKKAAARAASAEAEGAGDKQPTAKAKAGPPKEVHLSWGVTAHDLSHKLGRARDFLAKGSKVVVVLKDKKGVSKAAQEVQQQVRKDIKRLLEESGEGESDGAGKCRKEGGKGGEWRMEFEKA